MFCVGGRISIDGVAVAGAPYLRYVVRFRSELQGLWGLSLDSLNDCVSLGDVCTVHYHSMFCFGVLCSPSLRGQIVSAHIVSNSMFLPRYGSDLLREYKH